MSIRPIHSLNLPELEPYRTLRRPEGHKAQGIFVAEGEKVVRRLLSSELEIVSILLTEHLLEQLQKDYNLAGVEIFVSDKQLLEDIVGFRLHQGIMAVARVPTELSLSQLLERLPNPFLLVALDGIVSSENVGVIVRNAVAFGVHGIIAGFNSSSPYLRRAVRNSMGAVFRVPVLHADLTPALQTLGAYCKRIAAAPGAEQPLESMDIRGSLCVVLGNEGHGVSKEVLALCDQRVAIPMQNNTDSLNVASAAAVFFYEIARAFRPNASTKA